MDLNLKKILNFFSKNPIRWWTHFLIFLFFLFALSVFFGIYKFKKVSRELEKPIFIKAPSGVKIPERAILEKTVAKLDEKAQNFEEAKTILPPKNP